MRRSVAIAITLTVLLASPPSFGQQLDAGADATAPAVATPTETEGLPMRLGKALAFGVVVTVVLLGGGLWRRSGRARPRRQAPATRDKR